MTDQEREMSLLRAEAEHHKTQLGEAQRMIAALRLKLNTLAEENFALKTDLGALMLEEFTRARSGG